MLAYRRAMTKWVGRQKRPFLSQNRRTKVENYLLVCQSFSDGSKWLVCGHQLLIGSKRKPEVKRDEKVGGFGNLPF